MFFFNNPIGQILGLSFLTTVVTTFLRLYSDPERNPFKLRRYRTVDFNFGLEFTLTGLVSYYSTLAKAISNNVNLEPSFLDFVAGPAFVLLVVAIPAYTRVSGWKKLSNDRYILLTRGVLVPNVLGFLSLILSISLVSRIS